MMGSTKSGLTPPGWLALALVTKNQSPFDAVSIAAALLAAADNGNATRLAIVPRTSVT